MNDTDTLDKVDQLPIYQFNMKGVDPGMLCRGPMAQDWHALFPSSKNPLTIDTQDLDGITLSALKGLLHRVKELEAKVEKLENNK